MVTIALAAAAGAFAALVLVGVVIQRRDDRRWKRERERMAAYHERMAAENGRPHTGAVIQGATRRDDG